MKQSAPVLLGSPVVSRPRFAAVAEALRFHSIARPAKVVLEEYYSKRCITFSDLDLAARKVAAELLSRAPVGSVVALTSTPGIDAVIAYCGIIYAGMAPVLLPTPEEPKDLQRFAVIVRELRDRVACDLVLEATNYALSEMAECSNWYGKIPPLLVNDLVSRQKAIESPVERPESATAHWLFSSGTTGPAKAIRLSSRAIAFNCEYTATMWEFVQSSRIVGNGTLYHSAGIMTGYLMPIFIGASAVVLPPNQIRRDPQHLLTAVSKYGASHLACPASTIASLLELSDDAFDGRDFSSWRSVIVGGEPITRQVFEGICDRLSNCGAKHVTIGTAFGMSEAAGLISSSGRQRPLTGHFNIHALSQGRAVTTDNASGRFIASGGAPKHGVQMAVVDQNGMSLPAGRLGRVVFASPSLSDECDGGGADRIPVTLSNGAQRTDFFETGDFGFFIDSDARTEVAIVGRIKEAIPVAGFLYHGDDLEYSAARKFPDGASKHIIAARDPEKDGRVLLIVEQVSELSVVYISTLVKESLRVDFPSVPVRIAVIALGELPSLPTSSKKPRARAANIVSRGSVQILHSSTLHPIISSDR